MAFHHLPVPIAAFLDAVKERDAAAMAVPGDPALQAAADFAHAATKPPT